MAGLYAQTLLAGALLLFAVPPMAGRMLLPMLGGSPAVWNTCLVKEGKWSSAWVIVAHRDDDE